VRSLRADFLPALVDPDLPVPAGLQDGKGRPAGRRFNVYRNNVIVSLMDALEQGFPAVARLLGPQNFANMARAFVRDNPPQSQLMMQYGATFPGFLAGLPAVAHLGYLADVARLELAMRRAYHAADSQPLDPAALAALSPDTLAATAFHIAAPVQTLASAWPVHAIWTYTMVQGSPKPQAEAQDALVTRPGFDPEPHALAKGGAAFITALMNGHSLGAAHDHAVSENPQFDPTETLGLLIAGGAITELRLEPVA
jgi:hypothetical protein